MLEFKIYETVNLISLKFDNFYSAIHECLMLLKNTSLKNTKLKNLNIDVFCKEYESITNYDVYVDTIKINGNFIAIVGKKKYNLNDYIEFNDFFNIYNNFIDANNKNELIKKGILNILFAETAKKTIREEIQQTKNTNQNKEKSEKELLDDILVKINKNTQSLIDSKNENENESESENEGESESESGSKLENKKSIFNKANQCSRWKNNSNEDPEIQIEKVNELVEKLEKVKVMTENAITNIEIELNEEEENLVNYISNYNIDLKEKKRKVENFEREISIFKTEKEYTYKNIYDKMIKTGGISFDKIPSLFISKFPVYLFMDGKDCNGNTVRDKLLDREDEYIIFTVLHESLVNEEIVDSDEYMDLIYNFINFLPNGYQVVTEKEIMDYYNNKNNNTNNMIFKEIETEKQECDKENENNNYLRN